MKIQEYKDFLLRTQTQVESLKSRQKELKKKRQKSESHLKCLGEAREVMGQVGVLAQMEIKQIIEELVTQSLQAVFGDEYSFEVEDQIQRNKPETNFYVVIDGRRHLLKGELGGGVVDLVAFSLRVVLWAITSPRTRYTIILDEPLKFVDKTRLEQVGVMIKKLSEMLGLQFIIVTHEEQLMDAADRAYLVEKVKGHSKVRKIV